MSTINTIKQTQEVSENLNKDAKYGADVGTGTEVISLLEIDHKQVKAELARSMGSDLHEAWKTGYKKKHGEEPRIKKSEDPEWNKAHGTDQVDIAHCTFDELPSNIQHENLEAAKVAIELVYGKVSSNKEITPEDIEEMADKVHEAWLKRNDRVYDKEYGNPEQAKPYAELSEVEKEKDRVQVRQAIEKVKAYFAGRK